MRDQFAWVENAGKVSMESQSVKKCLKVVVFVCSRAFQFGQKKFRFDSILATESIFFFDSIRQSDKFAACTLIFK